MDISEIINICKANDFEIRISTKNDKAITIIRKLVLNQFQYAQFMIPDNDPNYKTRFYICVENFKNHIKEIINTQKMYKELYPEEFEK